MSVAHPRRDEGAVSIVICERCDKRIDSDFDVECFTPYDEVMCQSCRDNRNEIAYDRQQQAAMDGDHLETKVKQDRELIAAGRGHLVR